MSEYCFAHDKSKKRCPYLEMVCPEHDGPPLAAEVGPPRAEEVWLAAVTRRGEGARADGRDVGGRHHPRPRPLAAGLAAGGRPRPRPGVDDGAQRVHAELAQARAPGQHGAAPPPPHAAQPPRPAPGPQTRRDGVPGVPRAARARPALAPGSWRAWRLPVTSGIHC